MKNNMKALKKEIYKASVAQTDAKIDVLKTDIKSLRDALTNDTKSSAGDKYETGTEMIQIEISKLVTQLAKQNRTSELLTTLSGVDVHTYVKNGSLIKTNVATYFIGASLGKMIVNDTIVYCVSIVSPIGQKLLSKKVGESIDMNGKQDILELT